MSEAVLSAQGLSKRYGEREALRAVSLDACRGELVAVIGPNGAGKTTLLSILAGIQRPDAGSVNRDPREIGWVPQQAALYGKLTVAENLLLFARLEKAEDPDAVVQRMLDLTGLADRAHDQVSVLSGGNRQRVNIAIGLLGRQPVLLLDEPSSALDPRQRERVWDFVLSLAEGGTTVVYSTHDIAEAERHADRVVVLADGESIFTGAPKELRDALDETDALHETGIHAGFVHGDRGAGRQRLGQRHFEQAFVAFLKSKGH